MCPQKVFLPIRSKTRRASSTKPLSLMEREDSEVIISSPSSTMDWRSDATSCLTLFVVVGAGGRGSSTPGATREKLIVGLSLALAKRKGRNLELPSVLGVDGTKSFHFILPSPKINAIFDFGSISKQTKQTKQIKQ